MSSFFRVAAAVPKVKVADVSQNVFEIIKLSKLADKKGVELLVFPQLSITGYTAGDIFFQDLLIKKAKSGLEKILSETKKLNTLIILGLPIKTEAGLINACVFCHLGSIVMIKTNDVAESRHFVTNSGQAGDSKDIISQFSEDKSLLNMYLPNSLEQSALSILIGEGRRIKINLDFALRNQPDFYDIHIILDNKFAVYNEERIIEREVLSISKNSSVIYVNPGMYESTTDGVMSGNIYIAEDQEMIKEDIDILKEEKLIITDINIDRVLALQKNNKTKTRNFRNCYRDDNIQKLSLEIKRNNKDILREVSKNPFSSDNIKIKNEDFKRIFQIQTAGLIKRMDHIGTKKVVVAVSGGLDSTLALLVAKNAFSKAGYNKSGIIGITMPGFGTSSRTYENGNKLMEALGITKREISIVKATTQHFLDIDHNIKNKDVTFENAQARERMQIAMDVANMENALVVGTGDLSELVLGFTTYNGDHMSMYSVNSGLPKTVVRGVTKYLANSQMYKDIGKILLDIVNTPVSPELLPTGEGGEILQVTEDILGPYMLNDFFIYYSIFLGYDPLKIAEMAELAFLGEYTKLEILKYLKNYYSRFFSQQFKRSCLPDGVAVASLSISPRTGLKMPSDALATLWVEEIKREIEEITKK